MTAAYSIGSRFRLVGQTTEFRVVKIYEAAGFIPSVVGHTLDGARKTCARVADVTWLDLKEPVELTRAMKKRLGRAFGRACVARARRR